MSWGENNTLRNKKGWKHENKQNRSQRGKQTTMWGGVSCGEDAPEPGSPTVAHCSEERESHTSAGFAWRKKHTVKVHVQGHNDKGRGLVHCAQRTILATTAQFVCRVVAGQRRKKKRKNVHLTKRMRKVNVTLSLFILWGCTAVRTQRNVSAIGHHIGYDEVVLIYLWLCLCLCGNMPRSKAECSVQGVIDKWFAVQRIQFKNLSSPPLYLLKSWVWCFCCHWISCSAAAAAVVAPPSTRAGYAHNSNRNCLDFDNEVKYSSYGWLK